jgi:hypothetical protein
VWSWPSWIDRDFRQAKVKGSGGGEVQLRGNGHWTLLAGAKRSDGEYEVVQEPLNGIPTEPPRALITEILKYAVIATGGSYGGSGLEEISLEEAWKGAPWQDGRKNLLAGLAWYLAIRGESESSVLASCLSFNNSGGFDPPLSEELVMHKVEYTCGRASKRRAEMAAEQERELSGQRLWTRR